MLGDSVGTRRRDVDSLEANAAQWIPTPHVHRAASESSPLADGNADAYSGGLSTGLVERPVANPPPTAEEIR